MVSYYKPHMPKRNDLQNILIIGSGPIVIGQGCEFDYSGTQACKALREEGYRVVLINSNPATIMTDPDTADRTYVEPITPEFIGKILENEKAIGYPIDALLPTLGGQTGLNCAMETAERGLLKKYDVELIGANQQAIHKAEDRTAFKETMLAIGMDMPRSGVAHTWAESLAVLEQVKLPCCIRPAYTLGGEGGGFVRTAEEFETIAKRGLSYSRVTEILIEESLFGWKEFELEVMRDRADNVVIICSIENIDAMGVHTGDSITVAPAQTLTDREYQKMRDSALAIIRAIGVDTGGCNIQFGVDPNTGRQVVIEMNPRVSRSSALASKATGYPIARIAAKLAVGYTLDELPNDITRTTPASFEPTIDYCVVKMPRWAFEKFPDADETLTTQMKSVGEAMAIGRTFKEAFQKCIRSMEIKRFGFGLDDNDAWLKANKRNISASSTTQPAPFQKSEASSGDDVSLADEVLPVGGTTATEAPPDVEEEHAKSWPISDDVLCDKLSNPCQGRPYYIRYALKQGWSIDRIYELTMIDRWFLHQMSELVDAESWACELASTVNDKVNAAGHLSPEASATKNQDQLRAIKQLGYSDIQISSALSLGDTNSANALRNIPVSPCYKLVDTCAAEFEAATPYYYSTHESPVLNIEEPSDESFSSEVRITDKPKIVVLGGGPNRIGQGIEFDYCCCHASYTAKQAGYESVMINSNPETVSTDFDTSDMLFFEPLTHEDTFNIIERLNGCPLTPGKSSVSPNGHVKGVIVQFGGQTPLNLAQSLKDVGVPIIGTQPEWIDLAENRDEFQKILRDLSLLQPPNGIARSREQAKSIASELGFPILVRPSYVLGGRGMKICNNTEDLEAYLAEALGASDRQHGLNINPVLIDKFLTDAIEVDVDAVSDFGQPRTTDAGPEPSCMVAGVMEHIEEAGVHSGDSTCVLPPFSIGPAVIEDLFRSTRRLAQRLNVCGAMNVQYAILNRTVYVLEVNPRASRTLPFVAKATGVPWAKIATRVMLGDPLSTVLDEYNITQTPRPTHTSIKAPVFPFHKLNGVDVILGPEMRSTGEVMAIAPTFGQAFAKSQIATGLTLPTKGNVLVSVNDPDKPRMISLARDLYDLGFAIYSTVGTRNVLADAGIPATLVSKSASTTDAPFLQDLIEDGTLDLLINTPIHTGSASDEGRWRASATSCRVPLITTLAGARAAVAAIRALSKTDEQSEPLPLDVKPLQDYFNNTR